MPAEKYGVGRFEWERLLRRILIPSRYRAAKVVGFTLATYANFEDGKSARPGGRRLVDQCQLSERTVRDSLRWLRDNWLIHRALSGSSAGMANYTDVYWLSAPTDWRQRFEVLDENWDDGTWEPWIPKIRDDR